MDAAMSGEKTCAVRTKNLLPTVKFGGGKVLVRGCMAASGGGNLVFFDEHMTAMMYVNILHANLKTSARKLGLEDCFHFQQDNNLKHTALCTSEFLLYNGPRRLSTLPQSPNMNVIENLWSLLEVKVREKNFEPWRPERALQAAWSEICSGVPANLVDSMPHRLQAANGMHTQY